MLAFAVIVNDPGRYLWARIVDVEEQPLVQEFVTQSSIEAVAKRGEPGDIKLARHQIVAGG